MNGTVTTERLGSPEPVTGRGLQVHLIRPLIAAIRAPRTVAVTQDAQDADARTCRWSVVGAGTSYEVVPVAPSSYDVPRANPRPPASRASVAQSVGSGRISKTSCAQRQAAAILAARFALLPALPDSLAGR
jgi:hypothetical protein